MRRKGDLPAKTCVQCGRPMVWRKKWEKTWDEVKFCSDRCRTEAKRRKSGKENVIFQQDKETFSPIL